VPTVPLLADFQREAKRLRLAVAASEKQVELDLREDGGRERSALLHRLAILGVPWGEPLTASGKARGTFKELWRLRWDPGYVIGLVENARYGNTIASAARARLTAEAAATPSLAALSEMLHTALRAGLQSALAAMLARFDALAAATTDVPSLMTSLPPLLDLGRYGDVRGTDTAAAASVAAHLVERIAIGLPLACQGLDDDGAAPVARSLEDCDQALKRSRHDAADWCRALLAVADASGAHALLAGRATRLLLDRGEIDAQEAGRRLGLALSPAVAATEAAWIEGLLGGSGLLLIHEPTLLGLIDAWLCTLSDERFNDVLPLLRRAFARFEPPERRQIGERLKSGRAAPQAAAVATLDAERVALVLPTLKRLLGIGEAAS
jgi:hypothetical protein